MRLQPMLLAHRVKRSDQLLPPADQTLSGLVKHLPHQQCDWNNRNIAHMITGPLCTRYTPNFTCIHVQCTLTTNAKPCTRATFIGSAILIAWANLLPILKTIHLGSSNKLPHALRKGGGIIHTYAFLISHTANRSNATQSPALYLLACLHS